MPFDFTADDGAILDSLLPQLCPKDTLRLLSTCKDLFRGDQSIQSKRDLAVAKARMDHFSKLHDELTDTCTVGDKWVWEDGWSLTYGEWSMTLGHLEVIGFSEENGEENMYFAISAPEELHPTDEQMESYYFWNPLDVIAPFIRLKILRRERAGSLSVGS
eukprot:308148-Prymnesium_polylepis.1